MRKQPIIPLTTEQQKLVEDNMKLVYGTYHDTYPAPSAIMRRWEEDIIQEGMLGLCKAAANYDPAYGTTFSTFAVPCIRNQIGMLIRQIKNDWMVDSLDELLNFDGDGDKSLNRWETIPDDSISIDCIVTDQQHKELVLRIIQGATSERTKFVMTQILTNNLRLRDVYLQFYADKSYYSLTKGVELGCRKIRAIVENVPYINIPREEDYKTKEGFLADMKRLWSLHNPKNFKPNKEHLKEKEQV